MTPLAERLPSPVRAVLLDAGGVLLLPRGDLVVETLDRLGLRRSTGAVRRAHYGAMRCFDATGGTGRSDYAVALVEALGIPAGRRQEAVGAVRTCLDREGAWDEVAPRVREGLEILGSSGLRVGIVSNSDGTVEAQLRRQSVCQVGAGAGVPVAAVVDSTIVGIAKPDPAVFDLALERLGVGAATAVHVGDSTTMDVAGARAAGVTPVHMDPFGDCTGEDHGHVGDLVDLARAVTGSGS